MQKFLSILIYSICFFGSHVWSQSAIDSLKSLLLVKSEDSNKVITLEGISVLLVQKGELNEARKFADDAMSLSEKINYLKGKASAHKIRGNICFEQSNYPEAINNQLAALKILIELADKKGIANSYNIIGNIYTIQGNYPEALKNHLYSLKISEEIVDRAELATGYNNIGNVYFYQDNFSEALKNYSIAMKIRNEINDKLGSAAVYISIGNAYWGQYNYPEALKNYSLSKKIYGELGRNENLANICINMGIVYTEQGNFNEALKNLFMAKEITQKTGNKSGIALSCSCIGDVYLKLKEIGKARDYFKIALVIAKEINNKKLLVDFYNNISRMDSIVGDFKSAYLNYNLYSQYKDSLLNQENIKKIIQTQMQYDFDKKEAVAIEEKQKQQLIIQKSRLQIIFLISGIVGILIMGFLFFSRFRLKVKQKFNTEILKQQELRIKAIVETQEEERDRIAKDLHDGAGQLLSGLKFSLQNLSKEIIEKIPLLTEKLSLQNRIVDEAASEVRAIAHQMMPQALNKAGLVSAMEDMLDRNFSNSKIKYKFIHTNVSGKYQKNIEIGLYRISQELVNNILKHSGANEVSILLTINDNQIILMMEDNGKGFDFEEQRNKGMGLLNIITRTKSMNGKINFETASNGGTLATTIIPLV